MSKSFPSISIITLTYNPPIELFNKFLVTVHTQEYPKKKIEHIILDGGSDEKILTLARKFPTRIVSSTTLKTKISRRLSMGVKLAKNDLILLLHSDNLFEHKNTLQRMAQPFMEDDEIIASFPHHYGYRRSLNTLDRYCALMGVSDPVAYYMNKADREPHFVRRYEKGKIVASKKGYDIIAFDASNLPTVGDNGFLMKKSALLKAKISEKYFFHTDLFIDLIRMGYNGFAVIYGTSVIHVIRSSILNLITRRIEYMERDATKASLKNRRYRVFSINSPRDIMLLFRFIFFTVTLVQPMYISFKGYRKIHDNAWFLHLFMCQIFMVYYAMSIFRQKILIRK